MFKFKNALLIATLPTLEIILSLGLNSAHAMETEALPDTVLCVTFKELCTPDLGRVATVSQQWKKVSSSNEIWKEAARKREEVGKRFHPNSFQIMEQTGSWKEVFQESYIYVKQIISGENFIAFTRVLRHPHFQEIEKTGLQVLLNKLQNADAALDTIATELKAKYPE